MEEILFHTVDDEALSQISRLNNISYPDMWTYSVRMNDSFRGPCCPRRKHDDEWRVESDLLKFQLSASCAGEKTFERFTGQH